MIIDPVYPIALILVIFLFIISVFTSKVLTGNRILISENFILRTCVESYIGIIFLITLFATIRCNGISFTTPALFVILFIYLRAYRSKNIYSSVPKFNIQNIFYIILCIVFCLMINILFFAPYDSQYFITNNLDFGFYSSRAKYIYNQQIESIIFGDTVKKDSGRILYHYPDLWLTAAIHKIFNFNSYYAFVLVVKTFLSAQFVLIILGLLKKYKVKTVIYFYAVGILFFGATIFFIRTEGLNWVLQFDYYPSIINYHGGLFACLHVAISFLLCYLLREKVTGYLLLAIGGVINALLLPAVILFFFIKFIIQFINSTRYKKKLKKLILSPYLILIIITAVIYFFSIEITKSDNAYTKWDIIFSPQIFILIFSKSLFELFIVNILFVSGVLFIFIKLPKKQFIIDVFIFISISFFIYSALYETIRYDLWQIKIICCAGTLSVFGYFGILLFLNKLENIFLIIGFSLIVVSTIYFSAYNRYYSFGPSSVFKNESVLKIDRNKSKEVIEVLKGKGNGIAIAYPKPYYKILSIPAGANATEIIGLDQLAFRINLSEPDTINAVKRKSLQYYIQSDMPVYLPGDTMNLFKIIDEKNFQWVYTDNLYFTMPDYLLKRFPNKYSAGDISIYTK